MSYTRIGSKSDFSVFDIQNCFLRYWKPRKSCLHYFSTECHFYTSYTRIGLKSDFSVFDIQNRFLRYWKPRKSCLHYFSTECHFYTSYTRIGLKSDFSVFDIQNRFLRYLKRKYAIYVFFVWNFLFWPLVTSSGWLKPNSGNLIADSDSAQKNEYLTNFRKNFIWMSSFCVTGAGSFIWQIIQSIARCIYLKDWKTTSFLKNSIKDFSPFTNSTNHQLHSINTTKLHSKTERFSGSVKSFSIPENFWVFVC